MKTFARDKLLREAFVDEKTVNKMKFYSSLQ